MLIGSLPISVLADSYKAAHYAQYPEADEMVAYGEFRRPFKGLEEDERLVFYGMRYIVETFLCVRWTEEDVRRAAAFYRTHNAGFTAFPFPEDLFLKFVRENDGYFPVVVEALAEGSVVYPHVPVYQVSARGEYARLVTFFETLLTHVWYPSCVATLSRKARASLEAAFDRSVEDSARGLLASRLHDFGFRGCTCVEQSVLGGAAHLLSFDGSDTMSAAFYVQYHLNEGRPVATSIPATEHSVMTSWPSEEAAVLNMIERFGDGAYACVMDSYDYLHALHVLLPAVAEKKIARGGFLVVRPDSGDPVEAVLEGLKAEEAVFGADVNSKGYKVIRGAGVIQGDGIDIHTLRRILAAIQEAGYSAQNAAFGMGGGLLQRVNRDTMSFATKLSFIRYADGTERDVIKAPKTDIEKFSLPGKLRVVLSDDGIPTAEVAANNGSDTGKEDNLLKVVYNCGPVPGLKWDTFDQVRERLNREWAARPPKASVISPALRAKVDSLRKSMQQ